MKKKANGAVTWMSVNNWIPIVTSAVMIALAFGVINTRLALIEQKIETISKQQTTMIELFKSTEQRYGEIALQVNSLEVKSHSH